MTGDSLRAWRKSNRLSRQQVADRLGISARTYETWEQRTDEIPARAGRQVEEMMRNTDILSIPLSEELKQKLRSFEKRKGISAESWAAEILDKILE